MENQCNNKNKCDERHRHEWEEMYEDNMCDKEKIFEHNRMYNDMNISEKHRKALMLNIMKYQLATLDSALFLDTHPNDPITIIRHNEYSTKLMQLKDEFAAKYGPLDLYTPDITNSWRYLEGPWPWEEQFN